MKIASFLINSLLFLIESDIEIIDSFKSISLNNLCAKNSIYPMIRFDEFEDLSEDNQQIFYPLIVELIENENI